MTLKTAVLAPMPSARVSDGGEREAGSLAHGAQAEAEVAKEAIEPDPAAAEVEALLSGADIAEGAAGLEAGLRSGRRLPGGGHRLRAQGGRGLLRQNRLRCGGGDGT